MTINHTISTSRAGPENGYDAAGRERPLLTIATPAYNEAENLPLLYDRLVTVMGGIGIDWEWIVVDDHSRDETFAVVSAIAVRDPRVRGLRLARNSGSHAAITCALRQATGDCAVVMAADLQDPPETLPELLERWRHGVQVVWAVRAAREGEKSSTVAFARLYYFIMRHVVGVSEMPSNGADFFLIDRRVIDALGEFNEGNASILALITWMGFRQASIVYTKQARLHGRSGWSLRKKVKLVLDSILSFSYLPIRVMTYVGFVVALLGLVYALVVVVNALAGEPTPGWTSLMVVVLVVGGVQMIMMGVLGEYLWRALDEARHRPRYQIEAATTLRQPQGVRHHGPDMTAHTYS